jgi:hypothetical protein
MTTLTMDEASLVSDYRREDDLEELWLELARDLIDHARITREWLVREARDCVATTGPVPSGDRERAADRRRRGWTPYDGGELRFQRFDIACKLDRREQLGALGNDGRDRLRLLRGEPAGADVLFLEQPLRHSIELLVDVGELGGGSKLV